MSDGTKNKILIGSLAAVLVAVLLYFLLRSKTAKGSEVTAKVASYAPTQLGAPKSAIAYLTYDQLSGDVEFWIDPTSGLKIPNRPGLLDGSVPLVALTDQTQVSNWWEANPKAVADINQSGGS